jgi:hypothetical protein
LDSAVAECAEGGALTGSEPPAKMALHHHAKHGATAGGAGAVLGPALGLTDAAVEMLADPDGVSL